ncbi:MAG TPA: hypothetical protein VF519_00175 [Mycobacteriales bacterium]|jgi:hypothetical protein
MRRLTLRKETLTELRAAELASVAGAAAPTTPLLACVDLSDLPGCDSILRPCISLGCTK